MADRNALITQFMDVTNSSDRAMAESLLVAFNWDLDAAIAMALGEEDAIMSSENSSTSEQDFAPSYDPSSGNSRFQQLYQQEQKHDTSKLDAEMRRLGLKPISDEVYDMLDSRSDRPVNRPQPQPQPQPHPQPQPQQVQQPLQQQQQQPQGLDTNPKAPLVLEPPVRTAPKPSSHRKLSDDDDDDDDDEDDYGNRYGYSGRSANFVRPPAFGALQAAPFMATQGKLLSASQPSSASPVVRTASPMDGVHVHFNVNWHETPYPIQLQASRPLKDLRAEIARLTRLAPANQLLIGLDAGPEDDNRPLGQILGAARTRDIFLADRREYEGGLEDTHSPVLIDSDDDEEASEVLTTVTYNGQVIELHVVESQTVGEMKEQLESRANVAYPDIELTGWPRGQQPTDRTTIKSLLPPGQSTLALTLVNRWNNSGDSGRDARPRRVQAEGSARNDATSASPVVEEPDSDSEIDVFYEPADEADNDEDDAEDQYEDDSLFDDAFDADGVMSDPTLSEVPDAMDETVACSEFVDKFVERFHTKVQPVFFVGSFGDALREATKEGKCLFFYLHSDTSAESNVFCSQVLCDEAIVRYLTENFVIWGWDNTTASRQRQLPRIVSRFGTIDALTNIEHYPHCFLLARVAGSLHTLNIVKGFVPVEELYTKLLQTTETSAPMLQEEATKDRARNSERLAREEIKIEQDRLYRESLEQDRLKELEKQKAIDEQQRLEAEAHQQAEDEQTRIAILISTIPPEPAPGSSDVATFRIRIPGGDPITRRFLGSTPIRTLINFIETQGLSEKDYRIVADRPRRIINEMTPDMSLKEAKLFPQETLHVESR
ncbi:hypothetical protein CAOG_08808 [Capsaspora owczarzaki ATCC 30864]|uniref:UBX domain-containing protein n=1 Tax=Capsaspora owczarzaki (strain ATCC 30864) TaxID=595528 RepID=A0A0D2UFU1_CAPO3|nr:hypothetical protein CAOG_08808 [Capsaspora owczarzaki ATCC 30864]KJE93996.1 hypothetical protein CAOG_008808 [Capsaspora owczarzaki ATCC 30864]|eukprot:XP_011270448.1 hypothetical protein CAOG_08808 [Capsaspora owczarzaki ATCC 30864]